LRYARGLIIKSSARRKTH